MERRKPNFLQKMYSREIHGTFFRGRPAVRNKAIKLFNGSIPNRLVYLLSDVFGRRNDHILVGITRCGQFIITYSFTVDVRDPVQLHYRYRLHWWAFHGALPVQKVAEVQLFDCQDILHPLHVGIAQWPNVTDKMIVYGYSEDQNFGVEGENDGANRTYYITVTTLPSLHNCLDCKAVAESFDEEDMAAQWDQAISFSCLKHGLTIHTEFEVAPPYPKFNPIISLKMDYKMLVNTGNFLHVLYFHPDKELKPSTERDTIVPDEISHRIGEYIGLSPTLKDYKCPWRSSDNSGSQVHRRGLSKSINNAWHNTIMDKANKVYAFEESEDGGFEKRFNWYRKRRIADKMYEFPSDDENMENKCPPAKMPRYHELSEATKAAMKKLERKLVPIPRQELYSGSHEVRINRDSRIGHLDEPFVVPDAPVFFKSLPPNFRQRRHEHSEINSKASVPNTSVCDSENSDLYDVMTSSPRGRSDNEIVVPQQNPVDGDCNNAQMDSSLNCSVYGSDRSSVKEDSSCINLPVSQNEISPTSVGTLPRPPQNVASNCNRTTNTTSATPVCEPSNLDQSHPLGISVINPDLAAILAEWEADSVSSLSPRSESLSKNEVIQSFLELIPGMTLSPRSCSTGSSTGEYLTTRVMDGGASKLSSPNTSSAKYSPLLVVLRPRNCNQDKEIPKSKDQEERLKTVSKEVAGKSSKDSDNCSRQRMISGCSVRFDRLYIELDTEIISSMSADFDDDDQGTGFHCALPLSVHGTAYAELQMISRQKAERLSMNCERVFQTSFDIEQFCFKAANIICQCEGFKFWFCSDYDVELIDVCAYNADILAVICMRVNAEKKSPKNEEYSDISQRQFYRIKCVFLWNPEADRCSLEAYSPLVESRQVGRLRDSPARREAELLGQHLRKKTLVTVPAYPPIRTFEHRLWTRDTIHRQVGLLNRWWLSA